MNGHHILNDPFLNKGTAFSLEERKELGLVGLLPPHVQTIEEQAAQAYAHYQRKDSNIEKRHFLMEIFNTNRTLFLPFVKPIKVFDEKYIEFNSQNKEIVFFWTKVSCKKEYTKLTPYVENF